MSGERENSGMVSENSVKIEPSVDRIFSSVNILKIAANTSAFRKWLKDYHKITDDSKIFTGYKFFLDACIRGFINALISEMSFDLEEDFTFFRARFVGVELDDIPNTCEKTIFIKNVWNLTKNIRKAKGWEEMAEAVKSIDKLFHVFDAIFEQNVFPTKGLDKKGALKISTAIYAHAFLNDTHRGFPHIYLLTPILKSSLSDEYLEKAYTGYVYTLQYLWFSLLGREKFERSSLKDLHKAHEIFSKEAEEKVELRTGTPVSEEKIKRIKEKINLDEIAEFENAEWGRVEEPSEEDIKKNRR